MDSRAKQIYEIKLGAFLHHLRVGASVTQRTLADAAGFNSSQYISNMERGLCPASMRYLRIFIKVCKVKPAILLTFINGAHREWMAAELKGR